MKKFLVGLLVLAFGTLSSFAIEDSLNGEDTDIAAEGSVTDGNVATFYGNTGTRLQDSGYPVTDFSTGTPVYVESDPVWVAEKSAYATGTPVYTESDPVWVAEKSAYATGTPVYTESDPEWVMASNGVFDVVITSSTKTNSPVTRNELFDAIESIVPLLLYGDTNAHPVIPGAATLSGHRPEAWSIVSSLNAGTNYIGTYFDTNTTTLIRAGIRQGRLSAIQTDGNRTAYPVIKPCWTDDDGATTNCIGESQPVEAFTEDLLSRTPSYSLATNIVGTNLREGVSYYLVREAAAGTCEITTYGGEGYNTLLETQQRGPVEGYLLASGDAWQGTEDGSGQQSLHWDKITLGTTNNFQIDLVDDDTVDMQLFGNRNLRLEYSNIRPSSGTSWRLDTDAASSNDPVFHPSATDTNSGIGWAGADLLSLISAGKEIMRLAGDMIYANTNLNMGGHSLTNVGGLQVGSGVEITDISTGAADNDKLATKGYVDDNAGGGGTPQVKYISSTDWWSVPGVGADTNTTIAIDVTSNGYCAVSEETDVLQSRVIHSRIVANSFTSIQWCVWSSVTNTGTNTASIVISDTAGNSYSTSSLVGLTGNGLNTYTMPTTEIPEAWSTMSDPTLLLFDATLYSYYTNNMGFPAIKVFEK